MTEPDVVVNRLPDALVWLPSPPLPFLGRLRKRCNRCGKRFWQRSSYERHWIISHAVDADRSEPHMEEEMTVAEALHRGYWPVLADRAGRQLDDMHQRLRNHIEGGTDG